MTQVSYRLASNINKQSIYVTLKYNTNLPDTFRIACDLHRSIVSLGVVRPLLYLTASPRFLLYKVDIWAFTAYHRPHRCLWYVQEAGHVTTNVVSLWRGEWGHHVRHRGRSSSTWSASVNKTLQQKTAIQHLACELEVCVQHVWAGLCKHLILLNIPNLIGLW